MAGGHLRVARRSLAWTPLRPPKFRVEAEPWKIQGRYRAPLQAVFFFLPESGKLAVQAHLQITVADSLRTGPFNVRAQRRVHRAASLSFPRARPTKIAKLPRGKLPRPSVPRDPRAVPPLQDPKDRRPGLAVSSPSATLSCHHELGGGPGGVEHGKYLVHPPCHAIMSSE